MEINNGLKAHHNNMEINNDSKAHHNNMEINNGSKGHHNNMVIRIMKICINPLRTHHINTEIRNRIFKTSHIISNLIKMRNVFRTPNGLIKISRVINSHYGQMKDTICLLSVEE